MPSFTLRLRRLAGELGYAQRRALELQTGVSFARSPDRSRRGRREVAGLDALWMRPPAGGERPLSRTVR